MFYTIETNEIIFSRYKKKQFLRNIDKTKTEIFIGIKTWILFLKYAGLHNIPISYVLMYVCMYNVDCRYNVFAYDALYKYWQIKNQSFTAMSATLKFFHHFCANKLKKIGRKYNASMHMHRKKFRGSNIRIMGWYYIKNI